MRLLSAVVILLLVAAADGAAAITCKDPNMPEVSCAASKGKSAIVKDLIQKGAPVDARDPGGATPLHWAARNGRKDVINLLLSLGADVDAQNNNRGTPLNWCAKWDLKDGGVAANILVTHRANVNSLNNEGWTPLMTAAEFGNADVVKVLLSHGATVDLKDSGGHNAWDHATERGHPDIAAMILAGPKAAAATTPVAAATATAVSVFASTAAAPALDPKCVEWKLPPIVCAAMLGQPAVVKSLIDSGVPVDAPDPGGSTALHWAARNGRKDVVYLLLDHGAAVNQKNDNGGTPLDWTAKFDKDDGGACANLLIQHGADVNTVNRHGWTPLMLAAEWGNTGVATALLSKGAIANLKEESGLSALDHAKAAGHADIAALIAGAGVSSPPAGPKAIIGQMISPPTVASAVALLVLGFFGYAAAKRGAATAQRLLTPKPEAPATMQDAATASRPLATGDILGGHYRVTGELGRGGMGVVHLAVDETLQRRVAIKQLKRDERTTSADLERFLREARLVAALKHPNLAEIHNVLNEGDLFLVFEYVEGKSLDKVLDESGRLTVERARRVLREVASALDYAHSRHIIHRDLKPSNVMITPDGTAKVMDFGIAHQASGDNTLTTTAASGSPPYMAPEQAFGSVSQAADIYALAVMTYEMLTGARPFNGPNYLEQKLQKIYAPPSERDASLGPGLDAFFSNAFDPDPTKRPQEAGKFLRGFEEASS